VSISFGLLLALSLANWRLTSLLYSETPFDWLRIRLGIDQNGDDPHDWFYPDNLIGDTFSCFWCLSLACGILLGILTYLCMDVGIFTSLLLWLASTGGAIVTEKWIGRSKARW